MNLIIRLCGIFGALITLSFRFMALGEMTNLMQIRYEQDLYSRLEDNRLSTDFLGRLNQELLRNDDAVINGIGFPASIKWAQVYERSGYDLHERIVRGGHKAMLRLIEDSGKETALNVLPVDEFKSSARDFGESLASKVGAFAAYELVSSVPSLFFGNTAEERATSAEDDDFTMNASRIAWWEQLRKDNPRPYGIRPWRLEPYAYLSFKIGHWGLDDRPILILDNRLSYEDFRVTRFKSTIALPLPGRFYLSTIFKADLFDDRSDESNKSTSVRLERMIGPRRSRSIMFVGYKSDSYENMTFGGFSKPF